MHQKQSCALLKRMTPKKVNFQHRLRFSHLGEVLYLGAFDEGKMSTVSQTQGLSIRAKGTRLTLGTRSPKSFDVSSSPATSTASTPKAQEGSEEDWRQSFWKRAIVYGTFYTVVVSLIFYSMHIFRSKLEYLDSNVYSRPGAFAMQ